MRERLAFFIVLVSMMLGATIVNAQLQYVFDVSIPVEQNGAQLKTPFASGLNTAQYHHLDINNDGVQDLVIFDRSAQRILTYLADAAQYIYSPQYEQYFPEDVQHWMVLQDYNCDGKADLFTSSLFGMSLYKNTSTENHPTWELVHETVFTEGSNGQINLQVSSLDFPGIQDVDGDGDLDILVYDFASGGGVHFHQNMSIERTGTCDIDLVRVTRRYGDFEECTCEDYIFGTEVCPTGGRTEHSGGKTILSYDVDEDGLQDVIIGQEYCTKCGFLLNEGTLSVAQMTSVSFGFPNTTNPISINFPAVFALDLDFDGKKDLVASPNSYTGDGSVDYKESNWLYKQQNGSYSLAEKNVLQGEMIDVGHKASPAFGDIDHDGDEDMMIGSGITGVGATIWWYENVGTITNPGFKMRNSDMLGMASLGYASVGLQMTDMNTDGWIDMVAKIDVSGIIETRIYWHSGNILIPYTESDNILVAMPSLAVWDAPYFYDTDQDGKAELFIGRAEGSLHYYRNVGSLDNPIWEVISESYLGIDDDFRARNLHLSIGDLDNDGFSELLAYDDSRLLKAYTNFLHNPVEETNLVIDSLTQTSYNHHFGVNSYPVITNLYGTTTPSIALGTIQGGVSMIRSSDVVLKPIKLAIAISLYPNPVTNNSELSILSNQNVDIRILSNTGQLIEDNLNAVKGEPLELMVGGLRAGLYIIQARNAGGQRTARQFVLIH